MVAAGWDVIVPLAQEDPQPYPDWLAIQALQNLQRKVY